MLPAEIASRVAEWRLKAQDKTLTLDELKEAIALVRQGRVSVAYASEAAKRKKAVAAIPAAKDLLSELESL